MATNVCLARLSRSTLFARHSRLAAISKSISISDVLIFQLMHTDIVFIFKGCLFITPNFSSKVPTTNYGKTNRGYLMLYYPSFCTLVPPATSAVESGSGGKHWKAERIVAISLVGLIPAGLIYPNAVVDYGLAVALPLHGHW